MHAHSSPASFQEGTKVGYAATARAGPTTPAGARCHLFIHPFRGQIWAQQHATTAAVNIVSESKVGAPCHHHSRTFSDHSHQGKHQLPLSTGNNLHLPANAHGGGGNSSSTVSRASFWGTSTSSDSYESSLHSSPQSPAEGSYTGYLGPPDAALRGFYDRYVPYGSAPETNDDPDIDVRLESGATMCWAERPAEIPVQSLSVQKKRKDKGKETDSRTKISKISSHKTRS